MNKLAKRCSDEQRDESIDDFPPEQTDVPPEQMVLAEAPLDTNAEISENFS